MNNDVKDVALQAFYHLLAVEGTSREVICYEGNGELRWFATDKPISFGNEVWSERTSLTT